MINQPWKWDWYQRAVKKHGWRGWQLNNAKGKRGADFGSDVHGILNYRLAEHFGLAVPPLFSLASAPRTWAHINKCATAMFDHIIAKGYKPVMLEEHLVSRIEKLHGSPDGIFDIGGRLVVVDFKTNTLPSNSWVTQLAIYGLLAEEKLGREVRDGLILHVNKKLKKPRVVEVPFAKLEAHWPAIRALRALWTYFRLDRLEDGK